MAGNALDVRTATRDDLPAIAEIQNASPQASRWTPESYLDHDCRVAISHGRVVGFLVARTTAPDEKEILNVAVVPALRRAGIGRIMMETILAQGRGMTWFLEVRESNDPATSFYKTLGFLPGGRRGNYYHDPQEAAIVMRLFS